MPAGYIHDGVKAAVHHVEIGDGKGTDWSSVLKHVDYEKSKTLAKKCSYDGVANRVYDWLVKRKPVVGASNVAMAKAKTEAAKHGGIAGHIGVGKAITCK